MGFQPDVICLCGRSIQPGAYTRTFDAWAGATHVSNVHMKSQGAMAAEHLHDFVQGLVPIVGIDMWEHAYYLQYRNKKPDYLGAVWDVMNWDFAAQKLAEAK